MKYCPVDNCKCIVGMTTPFEFSRRWGPECVSHASAVCVRAANAVVAPSYGSAAGDKRNRTRDGVTDEGMHRPDRQQTRPHRFCWECGGVPHWPIPCDMRDQWQEKVAEEVGTDADDPNASFEDVAHRLWLKANTKGCPKCKTPIEKNEGCNHMTCSNKRCRHEFCWVCAKPWDVHGTTTGGYFSCNIWREESANSDKDQEKKDEVFGKSKEQARKLRAASTVMARFVHHMERYNAHDASR